MTGKIYLSLCMIVKDEARVLARCLNSVKNLVNEIIVVDTGSGDSTRAIAKSWNAKIYDYTWCDNFSSARNYSLQMARGNWILVLDADEVLAYNSIEDFLKLLTDPVAEGYYIDIISLLGVPPNYETTEDMVVRLFKNRPDFRFEGVIHEQVRQSIICSAGHSALKKAPLTIYHDGYLSQVVKAKNKVSRNSSVISKALNENAANPFLLYSLGSEYFIAEDYHNALKAFQQALTSIPSWGGFLPDLVFKTVLCLHQSGRQQEMRELLEGYRQLIPQNPDILFLSGMSYLEAGKIDAAENDFHQYLSITSPNFSYHKIFGEHLIYQALAEINTARSSHHKAINYYFLSARAKPDYLYAVQKIIDIYKECKNLPDIDLYLDFCPTQAKLDLLQKLDWLKEVDLIIFLILGVSRVAVLAENSLEGEKLFQALFLLINNKQCHFKVTAASYLVWAIYHQTKSLPGQTVIDYVFEQNIFQNIKNLLLTKN